MGEAPSLSSVALAISSYRSDEAVIALLKQVVADAECPFGAVIVVDSIGSGRIHQEIAAGKWPVHYVNAEQNLGSAGNLDRRLKMAADLKLKWCLAVNHDGRIDPDQVSALLMHAESMPRVGAAYPQLVFERAGGKLDRPRLSFHSYGFLHNPQPVARDKPIEVVWSSSNGALYNLDAIRSGIDAWPELWMGYEDMAIGWELNRNGWTQLVCPDVQLVDNYEYSPVVFLGRTIHLAKKPLWYTYYHVRNLLLIAKKSRGQAVTVFGTIIRMFIDIFLIIAFRENKISRLKLILSGLSAGIRGRTGKGRLP